MDVNAPPRGSHADERRIENILLEAKRQREALEYEYSRPGYRWDPDRNAKLARKLVKDVARKLLQCSEVAINSLAFQKRENAYLHYSAKRKKAQYDTYDIADCHRNHRRNCKTLMTVNLCVHHLVINQDHTKQRTDWRRAMNSLQFQMRMEMCYQLRECKGNLKNEMFGLGRHREHLIVYCSFLANDLWGHPWDKRYYHEHIYKEYGKKNTQVVQEFSDCFGELPTDSEASATDEEVLSLSKKPRLSEHSVDQRGSQGPQGLAPRGPPVLPCSSNAGSVSGTSKPHPYEAVATSTGAATSAEVRMKARPDSMARQKSCTREESSRGPSVKSMDSRSARPGASVRTSNSGLQASRLQRAGLARPLLHAAPRGHRLLAPGVQKDLQKHQSKKIERALKRLSGDEVDSGPSRKPQHTKKNQAARKAPKEETPLRLRKMRECAVVTPVREEPKEASSPEEDPVTDCIPGTNAKQPENGTTQRKTAHPPRKLTFASLPGVSHLQPSSSLPFFETDETDKGDREPEKIAPVNNTWLVNAAKKRAATTWAPAITADSQTSVHMMKHQVPSLLPHEPLFGCLGVSSVSSEHAQQFAPGNARLEVSQNKPLSEGTQHARPSLNMRTLLGGQKASAGMADNAVLLSPARPSLLSRQPSGLESALRSEAGAPSISSLEGPTRCQSAISGEKDSYLLLTPSSGKQAMRSKALRTPVSKMQTANDLAAAMEKLGVELTPCKSQSPCKNLQETSPQAPGSELRVTRSKLQSESEPQHIEQSLRLTTTEEQAAVPRLKSANNILQLGASPKSLEVEETQPPTLSAEGRESKSQQERQLLSEAEGIPERKTMGGSLLGDQKRVKPSQKRGRAKVKVAQQPIPASTPPNPSQSIEKDTVPQSTAQNRQSPSGVIVPIMAEKASELQQTATRKSSRIAAGRTPAAERSTKSRKSRGAAKAHVASEAVQPELHGEKKRTKLRSPESQQGNETSQLVPDSTQTQSAGRMTRAKARTVDRLTLPEGEKPQAPVQAALAVEIRTVRAKKLASGGSCPKKKRRTPPAGASNTHSHDSHLTVTPPRTMFRRMRAKKQESPKQESPDQEDVARPTDLGPSLISTRAKLRSAGGDPVIGAESTMGELDPQARAPKIVSSSAKKSPKIVSSPAKKVKKSPKIVSSSAKKVKKSPKTVSSIPKKAKRSPMGRRKDSSTAPRKSDKSLTVKEKKISKAHRTTTAYPETLREAAGRATRANSNISRLPTILEEPAVVKPKAKSRKKKSKKAKARKRKSDEDCAAEQGTPRGKVLPEGQEPAGTCSPEWARLVAEDGGAEAMATLGSLLKTIDESPAEFHQPTLQPEAAPATRKSSRRMTRKKH